MLWLIGLALLTVACTAQPPRVAFDQTHYDFGELDEGRPAETAFRVINQGGRPLVFEKLEPSCGCTSAEASAPEVAPGGSETILVSWDTRLLHGAYDQEILVYSNAEGSPHHLTLTGVVNPWVVREPASLTLQGREPDWVTLHTPRAGFEFAVIEVKAPAEVEVGEPEPIEGGYRYPLRWVGPPSGERRTVQFYTDVENCPWLPVSVVHKP